MATDKKQTSMRISTEAYMMQVGLARKLGLSLSAVIEMAIRELARVHNVKAKPTK
jgi:hypothetical protein